MKFIESCSTRIVLSRNGEPTSLKIRRFTLAVLKGPDQGASCSNRDDKITVGTAQGADLLLSDRTVSRIHMEIAATSDGFLLRDLESTNGIYLEGYKVKELYLRHGARLGIGNTLLEFGIEDEESHFLLSAQQRFGAMVGADPAMRRLFLTLERIAPSESTVLIEGETGTGKELVARAIHLNSNRRAAPFVVVDAGSLPGTLIESELFGHEQGAFTGAVTARMGAFEEAQGGTVFLDELGELPLELQPKLLRVLEQREIRRVGGNNTIKADVRVIAATNRDLRKEINKGNFRADLYYRLAVVLVLLPPLRERQGDIPLLARTFLDELNQQAGKHFKLSHASISQLQTLPWYGNVRELRNFVERSVWLSEGDELRVTGMLDECRGGPVEISGDRAETTASAPRVELQMPYKTAKKQWIDYFDMTYLPALLERSGGNVSKASREAKLDRAYLFRLLRRLGLRG